MLGLLLILSCVILILFLFAPILRRGRLILFSFFIVDNFNDLDYSRYFNFIGSTFEIETKNTRNSANN